MSGLKFAESIRELLVYQKARELQQQVFVLTKTFPSEERFSLTDQLRRSSRSIGANIAEAWGKRRYEAHFISKLTDADGEQYETQHWIDTAVECGYLDRKTGKELMAKCEEVGRLLGGMLDKANQFCVRSTRGVHDQTPDYLTYPPADSQ